MARHLCAHEVAAAIYIVLVPVVTLAVMVEEVIFRVLDGLRRDSILPSFEFNAAIVTGDV